ncbi:bifunctional phosphopantothenoylcysteine decarboxylase/phosphopantothenate--cysteine ligase CoaBC [Latilactobacillus fuchuensis]|uniref:Coenzyme A biosynthesis bifunctional protein CoaBC n=2 Tax=Latilactobacillus fuchuensis TaxID=164393 RepID=A0A2N9DUP2_9LACO|nr:bifunctional phosphopantothenoylcysteine decarboxylase/phosphopantothenate--cysteine ligase CoaBC [Latilactobacillus fuchuensis]KRL61498.1 dfp protein [Latilactobacillus fuchuensis DSM 14340 = JCM 11249]MCP8857960.1 bifunctional phosphopantothenoylcysteine decarboxylase/phosphopantothenate--cysteine ligase CoaBC [Latilactobacillus fuchuensis]SPC37903.1 coenzyme A biosynthesis bifunctional protein CoaBC; phosphopantothenoylcysteine synthetase/decarboxylase [Latilactobacillus fuchuensis]
MSLANQKIAVYVTGGIAVYKVAGLVRQLIKAGATVQVAMTQSATEFVTPLTFATLTKRPVLTDLFAVDQPDQVAHIHLADWSDLAIVAPATANVLAKLANGLADDFVTTALLATTAPKLIVPAMNEHMWLNPATQRNVQQLVTDGLTVMQPATGFLAEGYNGQGRFPEEAQIVAQATRLLTPQLLKDQVVVVTAGGTTEPLDPVRFIGNRSSGKMGYAVAQVAAMLGAKVILISTRPELAVPAQLERVIYVQTAAELQGAVQAVYDQANIVVMAAAVADFKPVQYAPQKIKKQVNQTDFQLNLTKNPDILAALGQQKTTQFLVGFAAETNDLLSNAQVKLAAKQVDLLVANDVSQTDRGFNADDNEVTLLWADGTTEKLPLTTKVTIATQILTRIAQVQK